MRLKWTPSAIADLEELHAYISQDRPGAAADVAKRILESVAILESQPNIGRPGRIEETRELVIAGTPYFVPYRVELDRVVLLRVIHAARKWPPRKSSSRSSRDK